MNNGLESSGTDDGKKGAGANANQWSEDTGMDIALQMKLALQRYDITLKDNNATPEQNALTTLLALGLKQQGNEIPGVKRILYGVDKGTKERFVTDPMPEAAGGAIMSSFPPELVKELGATYSRDTHDKSKVCLEVDTLKMISAMKKYFDGHEKATAHMQKVNENRAKPAAHGTLR